MGTLQTMRNTRWVLGVIGLFFVSMIMSCQELEYQVRGKWVEAAMVDSHVEQEMSHGRTTAKRVVGYTFMDKETFRREYVDVPVEWDGGKGGVVEVEYLPGWEKHSRLVGQTNRVWVCIFLGSFVAAAVGVWNILRAE